MRFVHLSDIHLGYEAYRALSHDGLNQRGEDILAAYRQANAKILELRPDLVVESGDLFHSPHPSNRALAEAVRALLSRHAAGIQTVTIAGNHDVPTQRASGAPHAVLAKLPGIHAVFQGQYERRMVLVQGRAVVVHAIPHCLSHEAYKAECAKLAPVPEARYNVLTTHGSLPWLAEFRYARGNPQYFDEAWFDDERWDYVSLGHYHGTLRLRPHGRAWYAGSLERLSWNEADHVPGLILYDLDARTAEFHALEGLRPMADLGTLEPSPGATGTALTEDLCAALDRALAELPDRPILRLKVSCDRAAWGHVDWRAIDALRERALHVEIIPVFADAPAQPGETPEAAVGSLEAEWARYAEGAGLAEELRAKGREYLGEREG